MRILVVSQYFWPENFRINDLTTELCARGHQVTVLTGYPNYPSGMIDQRFLKNPAHYSSYGSIKVLRVPLLPRGHGALRLMLNYASFALSACLLGPYRLRGKNFDQIFVFMASPVTVGLPAILLKRIKRAPLTCLVLDLWPESLVAVGAVRSSSILKMVGWLVSFIYNRCDLILGQSRSFIPKIKEYCHKEKRVEYFPSWSDSIFDFSAVEPAPEVPVAAGTFNIMFTGNVGDAQDFPAILDAAEFLKDDCRIRWLIVGDGRAAKRVASEIARRGLSETVLMLGRFPVDRMGSFYKHADALLVSLKDSPIFSLTIPAKLQSYLAAGIPILAMLNGEGAEIVRRSGAGLTCNAGDAKGLSRAARQLSEMSCKELEAMGERGIGLTNSEFDRNTLISRLVSYLEEMRQADR